MYKKYEYERTINNGRLQIKQIKTLEIEYKEAREQRIKIGKPVRKATRLTKKYLNI